MLDNPATSPAATDKVRLIAIDIDGTLLDSKGRLPNANRQAIHDAAARGVEVVLATGRSFHHAHPVAERLGIPVILIVSNGALVKTPDGDTLATRAIPRHLASKLIVSTRPVRAGAALIFDRPDARQYLYERIDWSHPQRQWYYDRNRIFMTETPALETALDEEPIQVAFTGEVNEMRALADRVRDLPFARLLTLTLTEYEERDFSLFDVTAEGCSKGSTLADWASRRGISPADVMAVGDNLNDRDMLEFAGHPVVMGNAVAELKQRGWTRTADHNEAGLARAIEKLVLRV
jgi:Cof subfamily protein (haloacid dehalogenase superfamily)